MKTIKEMADTKTDGGAAFPRGIEKRLVDTYTHTEDRIETDAHPGMSLRDYFAAAAMTGLLGSGARSPGGNIEKAVADASYAMADALLKSRGE